MLIGADTLFVALIALAFDALIGDPDWLWQKLPHPVVVIGGLIDLLDRNFNREDRSQQQRKTSGIVVIIFLVAVTGVAGYLVAAVLRQMPGGNLVLGLICSVLIAQRSLYEHVARVRLGFATDGVAGARRAVAMIVGRDPERLDESGVVRAAIESTAENFSDGVVAPVFWLALFGLPGLLIYKTINTADSMIGHRTERHESFGWAAARLDDLVNLIPARLSGLLLIAVAPVAKQSIVSSFRIMTRDASKHRSPNAGWPESAMAGVLGIALAGPRIYAERVVDDPLLNAEGRHQASPNDIGRALDVLVAACLLEAAIYASLALVV